MEIRKPEIIKPARIGEMATLPLFHKLKNRKVIIAGASENAIWKAEMVAATGANAILLAGVNQALEPIENVEIIARKWDISDFKDCALAILSTDDENEAQSFLDCGRKTGVLVNVIDMPKYCDFQFGAIVNRSPLLVAITTDGASPALGQQLRGIIEQILPQSIVNWVKIAKQWRPKIKALNLDFSQRRAFWHRFAAMALKAPTINPDDNILSQLLDEKPKTIGEVALIGAGPGDPELLTLKALRALQRAEVVLFDDLVNPEILDYARREAQLIGVGKRGKKPSCAQSDICDLLVKYAREGKYVVRIKGGDPLIFGRATEEIKACQAEDIKIEIIPGISASQGIAASLGISLTDRDYAQRVQFVTGASKSGGLPPQINWQAIADNHVTTFVYMPRNTMEEFIAKAIEAGIDGKILSAFVIDGTRPQQKNIIAPLENMLEKVQSIKTEGPELLIIGNVLNNIV